MQDFNDNAPTFIKPPRNFTIRIAENASVGTEVIQVKAVDTDIGSNGQVRYRIRKDPLGNYNSFHINAVSGVITLMKPLDRERQKIYEIRVEAYDLGVPTPLQSDLDLTIYVKNINDHEPRFLIDEFVANFTEHKDPGTERILLPGTVDRDEEDEEEPAMDVCYFILAGNEDAIFELLPESHELYLNRELDREARAEYELLVKATEECLSPPGTLGEGEDARATVFDTNDDSLLKVKVTVVDIDDNAPQFVRRVFTGGISTDIDYGMVFMQIQAKDLDYQADLRYSLDGEIMPSESSEGLEAIRKPPFLVDEITGEIRLNFDPQKGMKGYFDFGVRVFDPAGHVDKAKVQIYLLREDQRVKFVTRSRPDEIRDRVEGFLAALSAATDAVVNVDAYRVHENPDGSVDKTKTDVLLHFVDPRDNTVMEVAEVLRLVDYRTEELDPVFKEYNVLHTTGVEPTHVQKASMQQVALFWLIGLCALLLLLLLFGACLHFHVRGKYLRKLRAATTTAYEDAHGGHAAANGGEKLKKRSDLVPNTNLHASEGSNPIWMTGAQAYDNLAATRDEDEDDVVAAHYSQLRSAAAAAVSASLDEDDDEALDSLDANVLLNDSLNHHAGGEDEGVYAMGGSSRLSHVGGGSTIRVGSSSAKLMDSTATRCSSSSGLGSGASRRLNDLARGGPPTNGIYSKNTTIAALFPSQMPPVEKLNGYGNTTYDEDDIPRTEL